MAIAGFRVIKGRFHILGFKPDGDSIRFCAGNKELFQGLYREYKNNSVTGDFQLRLEGIDAPRPTTASSASPGAMARDRLLDLLGFTQIERIDQKIVRCEPESIPGAILTQALIRTAGRSSYALLGSRRSFKTEPISSSIPDLFSQTLNAQMVRARLRLPAAFFYTSTPAAHRDWLREQAARPAAPAWGLGG